MIVIKKFPQKTTALLTAVALCNLTACKKYEEGPAFSIRTKKARLTGEWDLDKLTLLNGTVLSNYIVEFEFEKDGDFKQTVTYTYTSYYGSSYTYTSIDKGEWEWEDDKEKIQIEIGNSIEEFEIIRLTNKEMILEDEYRNEWEFEKQ